MKLLADNVWPTQGWVAFAVVVILIFGAGLLGEIQRRR